MKQPPKYKIAILIWVAIYPSANLIFFLLGDSLNAYPLYIRTLILTLILVPLMAFVLLPFLTKTFQKWLMK